MGRGLINFYLSSRALHALLKRLKLLQRNNLGALNLTVFLVCHTQIVDVVKIYPVL